MSEEESKSDEAAPEAAAPEASVASESVDDKPAKKKKKHSKAEAAEDAALSDPRATALRVAFDAGNFVRVRELATELEKSGDPVLVSIGNDYLARIAVDPIQLAFLGFCAAAILAIAWIYIPH